MAATAAQFDVMRSIATLIMFIVAIAAQAVAPVAANGHALASQGQTTPAGYVSQANQETAAATDHGHDGGASSAEHCTAIGHCSASAIDADRFVYRARFSPTVRITNRVSDEAAPGFVFPPYRPPSPLL